MHQIRTEFASPKQSTTFHRHNSSATRFQRLEHTISQLALSLDSRTSRIDQYDEALQLLEAIPVTTEEYSLALRRIQNARLYSRAGEFGGESFELKMLKSQIQKLAKAYDR